MPDLFAPAPSRGRTRAAAAGAGAAALWALQEPVDRRLFGCDYSDVAILGKAVTRGRHWRPAGLAVHIANGALFGLAFHELRHRTRSSLGGWPSRWRSASTSRSTR